MAAKGVPPEEEEDEEDASYGLVKTYDREYIKALVQTSEERARKYCLGTALKATTAVQMMSRLWWCWTDLDNPVAWPQQRQLVN